MQCNRSHEPQQMRPKTASIQSKPDATNRSSFDAGIQQPVSGDAHMMRGVEGESSAPALENVERIGRAPELNSSEDNIRTPADDAKEGVAE